MGRGDRAANCRRSLSAALSDRRRRQSAGAQACHPNPCSGAGARCRHRARDYWLCANDFRRRPAIRRHVVCFGWRRRNHRRISGAPVLSNFIAGIQIAVSQPIRIDDAVIVENEWGNIEEITFSYVVVRLWDWRRMVVPLSYFIEKPFQNWTRIGGELIGTVFLYVDPTRPVPPIREKLTEIAAQSKLWNGKVVNL